MVPFFHGSKGKKKKYQEVFSKHFSPQLPNSDPVHIGNYGCIPFWDIFVHMCKFKCTVYSCSLLYK